MSSQRSSQVDRPSGDLFLDGRLTETLVSLAMTFALTPISRLSASIASSLKKLDRSEGESTEAPQDLQGLEERPHVLGDPGQHFRGGSFNAALHGDALYAHFLKRCKGGCKVCVSCARLKPIAICKMRVYQIVTRRTNARRYVRLLDIHVEEVTHHPYRVEPDRPA